MTRRSKRLRFQALTGAFPLALLFLLKPAVEGLATTSLDMVRAAQQVMSTVGAELFSQKAEGQVISTTDAELIADFGGASISLESEYLVLRDSKEAATGFSQAIAAVRITDVKDRLAKAQILWADDQPRPGDLVKAASRTILFLAKSSDLAKHQGLSGPLADQAFLLAIQDYPNLQVVPVGEKPDLEGLAHRLKNEKEVGFLLKPSLLPWEGSVKLVASIRSVFSGQVVKVYDVAIKSGSPKPRASLPSKGPSIERPPPERTEDRSSRIQEAAFGPTAHEIAQNVVKAFPKVEGVIVGIEEDWVDIDLGVKDGVYEGVELQVFRERGEFKHPITGQVLGKLEKKLGTIRVIEVEDGFAVGEVVEKSEGINLAEGDKVRISAARLLLALPTIDPGKLKEVNVRALTKELSTSLAKTGRFELIEDRQLRAILAPEGISMEAIAEPASLRVLADKFKAQALLLGRLKAIGKEVFLEVEVLSTETGRALALIWSEAKIPGAQVAPSPRPPKKAVAP